MKKYLAILIVGLALAGCSKFQQDLADFKSTVAKVVTPDNFDSVTLAFYGVEATGNAYRDACERKIINKSCWTVIAQLQPYENKAYNSYLVLKDFVKQNPTLDASTYIKMLRDAVNALTTKQNENGVK